MGHDLHMNRSADKKTAFVTGASYGVGAATALALARAGFDVAVSATRAENLAETVAQVEATGAQIIPVVLDLGSQFSIERAIADVTSAFGQIDLLVNNAGSNLRKLAVDVTWAEWDAVMASNLRGAFFLSQHFGRQLIAGHRPGVIVNIASTHGLFGAAERSTYGIAKGALIQMTRMLAIEWAEHDIRVNAIAPGRLETRSPSRAARTDEGHAGAHSASPAGDSRRSRRRGVLSREPPSRVDHRANAGFGRRDHRCLKSCRGSGSFQPEPKNSSTVLFFRDAMRDRFERR
jgi:NAD(P)-dependent dehydrogenase (short-subunit alcohol dehydrogenase family)